MSKNGLMQKQKTLPMMDGTLFPATNVTAQEKTQSPKPQNKKPRYSYEEPGQKKLVNKHKNKQLCQSMQQVQVQPGN